MKRFPRLMVVTVGVLVIGASPVAMSADHRIRTLIYDPTQVFHLRGWVGYHIDIEFEAGETYQTMGGGDLQALTHGEFENHLELKPSAADIRTNLTVITSRRIYIFDYVVEAGSPDPDTDDLVYSVRFTYPPLQAPLPAPADVVGKELKSAEKIRVINRDYWACGNESLQPVEASDDGVHTRLVFGPRAEIPAIFVRNDDGTESLLNFSVDKSRGDVVIHRTARRLILRRGRLTTCIVNKGYMGAGERLESGTISPDVRRDAPGVRP